ncbi:MAG: hypothetical protein COX48_02860 [bacterium (Candidatus Stahlbacteria) CG23_combo_of_CG06-09_8_20_14_all_34_7]|nr:MAG: hypothetical protein COX48_02860 [bacterium (Candidatus Stahlbacteria) CG23_combo_of_CG06-09_8_20_14_all_34_7]
MIAFIGLGNMGMEYSKSRHNIGFVILDSFAAKYKSSFKSGRGEFFFAIVL